MSHTDQPSLLPAEGRDMSQKVRGLPLGSKSMQYNSLHSPLVDKRVTGWRFV